MNLHAIAAALVRASDMFESVTVEYPGVLHVVVDGAAWVIGTANGPLQADYYDTVQALEAGTPPNHSLDVDVAVTAPVADIAAAIFDALAQDL